MRCEYCRIKFTEDMAYCPQCGAPNDGDNGKQKMWRAYERMLHYEIGEPFPTGTAFASLNLATQTAKSEWRKR